MVRSLGRRELWMAGRSVRLAVLQMSGQTGGLVSCRSAGPGLRSVFGARAPAGFRETWVDGAGGKDGAWRWNGILENFGDQSAVP